MSVHRPSAAAPRPKRKMRPESEPEPQPAAEMPRVEPPPKPETRRRGDAETRRRGDAEKAKSGATAGLSGSAESTVGQANRGAPAVSPPKPPSRPVRPAAEEQHPRRGGLVPWNAPWGEEKSKEQPSVFVNEKNELEYVDSDVEPLDYAHQPAYDAAGSDDDPFPDDDEGGFNPDGDPDFGPDFDRSYEDEQSYLDARSDAEAA